jgi:SHS2 domain-containing protein
MYNTIEDGSSLEILLDDVSPETLFTESLLALSDVLSEATGGTQVTHEVQVTASDLRGLLMAWVEELVRLAESDGFIPERVYKERLESSSFKAMVAGERSIPQSEIRAVTCRGVELKRLDDGAWAARVSLDAGAE